MSAATSRRIREKFANGRAYYAYYGKRLGRARQTGRIFPLP
jgi:hypothetical protein